MALSDEAFARLRIAATRARPRKREPWLRKIARRLEQRPNALRYRRLRRRAKEGIGSYRVGRSRQF